MSTRETRRQSPLRTQALLVLGGFCLLFVVMWASRLAPREPGQHQSPGELVDRLPLDDALSSAQDQEAEDALAALGEAALPELEGALRRGLGLRGREWRAFERSGVSKRAAVVRVLQRIPGERATALLVRDLADPPPGYRDFYGRLRALEERELSSRHLTVLLVESLYPDPVLFALRKIGAVSAEHELRPFVERVHDPAVAAQQLRNVSGGATARARELWKIRLLSGKVLGEDMLPEMRQRARTLVLKVQSVVLERGLPGPQSEIPMGWNPDIHLEVWESKIMDPLHALRALGDPVQTTVRESATEPMDATTRAVLDMARLLVGETGRLGAVTRILTSSGDASLRRCAMTTLAKVKDPKSEPALWKALHDPMFRWDMTCIRVQGRDYRKFLIRDLAARTLIEMGADEEEVRRRSPKRDAK